MPRRSSTAAREAWTIMESLVLERRLDAAARISDLGLAPRHAQALRRLDPDEPIPMSRLAELLHCDNSNVTQIVDRLERSGLVERRPSRTDRRVKTLVVTERGREVREELERRMTEPPDVLARLRAEDARLLRDALRRMVEP